MSAHIQHINHLWPGFHSQPAEFIGCIAGEYVCQSVSLSVS